MALPLTILLIQQQPADEPPTARSLVQDKSVFALRNRGVGEWIYMTASRRMELLLIKLERGVRSRVVDLLRFCLLAFCCVFLSGCGSQKVVGHFRDEAKPDLRYQFGEDGSWSAEVVVELPTGVFPHGAGRRFDGTFSRSGNVIELVCLSVERQDPTSGAYREDDVELAEYSHRLLLEEGALVPVGPDGEREALFATDLNPLGARKLVRDDAHQ